VGGTEARVNVSEGMGREHGQTSLFLNSMKQRPSLKNLTRHRKFSNAISEAWDLAQEKKRRRCVSQELGRAGSRNTV